MSSDSGRWVHRINLNPPTLQDNTADADRLANALKAALHTSHVRIDLDLARQIPQRIRDYNHSVACILFAEGDQHLLLDVKPAELSEPVLGLAVDLGTSRVVLRLIDLLSGSSLAETAFNNPQIEIGPDILARIHYANQPEGLSRLHSLIVSGINEHAKLLCGDNGFLPGNIYLMALSGNTAMTHLFMGIDPYWIIREPYIPAVNTPGVYSARELGLFLHPAARTFVFPNVGSYFGGDLISGILYAGMHHEEEAVILVDVGTNAEVVVGNRHWLIACAGAAGPALEGGVTRMGMMAAPGVIDQIEIDGKTGEFRCHAIEEKPPMGICGSGVIDLAAQLFLSGMIDFRGKLKPSVCKERCFERNELLYLTVVPARQSGTGESLTISQADIDSLIRSKAAMYTILETITGTVGIELNDIRKFFVAGTFGSFIRPQSAIAIGMIPDLPLACYRPLGNSSLGGAAMLLSDPACMTEIMEIHSRITYLELNVNQEFMNRFSAAKFLPHTDKTLFPSVPADH